MSKTPVSTLQEYMAKGTDGMPNYSIVTERPGTHEVRFTFKVKCGKLTAQGTASSKKEAKHNAAKEMLKLLSCDQPNSSQQSEMNSSLSSQKSAAADSYYSPNTNHILDNNIFVNSVGKLSEHCVLRNLKNPEYTVISQSGPSHMMMFTMKCSVGSLSAEATASTKKQAKHDAAQNMYQLLIKTTTSKTQLNLSNATTVVDQCYEEVIDQIANTEIWDLQMPEHSLPLKESSERAKELFPKLRVAGSVKIVKNIQINDYHKVLKDSVSAVNQDTAQQKMRLSTVSNSEMILNEVLKILNLEFDCTTAESQCGGCVVYCTLDSSPVIKDVGVGKNFEEAKENAIRRLLNSIDLLLT